MGDFDFGQFKEIYDYLIDKLNDGDALTPQEKQVYDMLIGFANQGLNLTQTGDFQSLYTAFNALADEGTKKEFEKLYGTNFTQDEGGQIHFTQPGSIIEQFMRRGQSVNDGPAMAALSEGLQGYLKQIAQNKFSSMTNSYAAMTPIRGQNIQAATNAGNVASTAIGRRVPIGAYAASGARGGAGGEEGAGEGVAIDTSGGAANDKPGFLDKFGPGLLGILGTGALGVGGYLLKDWWDKRKKNQPGGNDLNTAVEAQPQYGQGAMRMADPYDYVEPPSQNMQMPGGDQTDFGYLDQNPYGDMSQAYNNGSWQQQYEAPQQYEYSQPQQYGTGGLGGGGGAQSWESSWNPYQGGGGGGQDWGSDPGYWDGGASYDPNSWSGDTSSGYWV